MRGPSRHRLVLALALIGALAGCAPDLPTEPGATATVPEHTSTPPGELTGMAVTVVSVTDGDTLRVRLPDGREEPVRVIGVDTPEHGECHADRAAEALREMVDGATVELTVDTTDRDRYGRLLRHLWLADGTLVGEELVRSGHAVARRYPPDLDHAERLEAAQGEARDGGVGIWSTGGCRPSPDPPPSPSPA